MTRDNDTDDDSLFEKADAAFRQAADTVVERAKQTATPVIVWEDGEMKELTREQAVDSLASGEHGPGKE